MICPIGRGIDVKRTRFSDNTQLFQESKPKHPVMLETRCRYDQVKMLVRKRIIVRIFENNVDTRSRFEVDPDIFGARGTERAQRTVDVPGTDVQDSFELRLPIEFEEFLPNLKSAWMHPAI